jgi:hypothetical protein
MLYLLTVSQIDLTSRNLLVWISCQQGVSKPEIEPMYTDTNYDLDLDLVTIFEMATLECQTDDVVSVDINWCSNVYLPIKFQKQT